MPVSSWHVKGTCYQNDLSLFMLTLVTWQKWYFSYFSTLKILCLFIYLFILYSSCAKNELCYFPWGKNSYIKYFCMGDLIHFSYLFIYSIICTYYYGYTDSFSILWIITLFVAQLTWALAIGNPFSGSSDILVSI